jgi:predicted acylesterase/phospholipase RssA
MKADHRDLFSNRIKLRVAARALLVVLCCVVWLPACAVAPLRTQPVPEDLSGRIKVFDQWEIRTWGDEKPEKFNQAIAAAQTSARLKLFAEQFSKAPYFLSISGGGANGAYGAGVITGWTKSGRRPTFTIITGVSTGALIAPFAFLGPEYDWMLEEIYNFHGTDDLVSIRAFASSIFSDAFFDSTPLKKRIANYLTLDEMQAIAEEHRRGRVLLIGTTDMDALRPVVWNIGKIALQGTPQALDLIQRIILASASIPVAFPPVIIDIAREGKVYQELHADGGVTNQVFLFPPDLDWAGFTRHFDLSRKPDLYIIRNDRLSATFKATPARLLPLAKRSMDSLIRTQGIGDLFRLYVIAAQNDFNYFLAHVPNDFKMATDELFDPDYMRPLFQIGYQQGLKGGCWRFTPPGLTTTAGDSGKNDDAGCTPGEGRGD